MISIVDLHNCLTDDMKQPGCFFRRRVERIGSITPPKRKKLEKGPHRVEADPPPPCGNIEQHLSLDWKQRPTEV